MVTLKSYTLDNCDDSHLNKRRFLCDSFRPLLLVVDFVYCHAKRTWDRSGNEQCQTPFFGPYRIIGREINYELFNFFSRRRSGRPAAPASNANKNKHCKRAFITVFAVLSSTTV